MEELLTHCKRIVSKNHHSVSKTVRKKLLTILLTAPNGRSHWEESTILSHFLLTSQEEFCFFTSHFTTYSFTNKMI